ncbi:hypothetical protein F5X68DRAFT_204176 [Plectosphaerella plurivora]|uniref:Uncharacterized protein n=1 Tax=Plectosphaerella plurivora TaxID=936078 RepID=A0A9P9AED9_9PEZI|nr:hypothetical protein F5X68DRAFT_204176 [Plectosphaerella plurivora]
MRPRKGPIVVWSGRVAVVVAAAAVAGRQRGRRGRPATAGPRRRAGPWGERRSRSRCPQRLRRGQSRPGGREGAGSRAGRSETDQMWRGCGSAQQEPRRVPWHAGRLRRSGHAGGRVLVVAAASMLRPSRARVMRSPVWFRWWPGVEVVLGDATWEKKQLARLD